MEVVVISTLDADTAVANFAALIFSALAKASLLFFHFLSPSDGDALSLVLVVESLVVASSHSKRPFFTPSNELHALTSLRMSREN